MLMPPSNDAGRSFRSLRLPHLMYEKHVYAMFSSDATPVFVKERSTAIVPHEEGPFLSREWMTFLNGLEL